MPRARKYANAAERQAAYRRRCAGEQGQGTIPQVPGYRRWNTMRSQAQSLLDQVISEMESYHAERSDAWQDSQRAETFSETLESLQQIADDLRESASL